MRLHLFASILDVIMTSIGVMKYRKKCRNGRETRYYINFELLNIEILKGPVGLVRNQLFHCLVTI